MARENFFSSKDCKYFDKGNGTCPFGVHCFYKHALADGKIVKKENPRYQTNSSGVKRVMDPTRLFDALLERDTRLDDDSDLVGRLLDLDLDDFFVAAAILGWADEDDDGDDEDEDDDDSSGSE